MKENNGSECLEAGPGEHSIEEMPASSLCCPSLIFRLHHRVHLGVLLFIHLCILGCLLFKGRDPVQEAHYPCPR